MAVHYLKTWPEFFQALQHGTKNFEYRKDDRRFGLGDVLVLQEWDPKTEKFSGKKEYRIVSYIMREGFGLPEGYVIMSWRIKAPVAKDADAEPVEGVALLNYYDRNEED
jgi:hypothetical protein